ncbi:hypothetical protein ACHAWF_006253 [Thalassiosira exigua]
MIFPIVQFLLFRCAKQRLLNMANIAVAPSPPRLRLLGIGPSPPRPRLVFGPSPPRSDGPSPQQGEHEDRFTPTNPCLRGILKLLSDEKSADVVFEVDGKKFHAHRLILKACAPTLAECCDDADGMKPVPIAGVDPEIFCHVLRYVYGGKVPDEVLEERSKDVIDACDRLGVGNLKVEAEGWYVKSTDITLGNFIDLLNFSDTKKCALLKEKVMDFLLENDTDALKTLSEGYVPQSESMLTDFLTATTRKRQKTEDDHISLTPMTINALRSNLDRKGLDVDGTREMLTAALRKCHAFALVKGAGLPEINGRYAQVGEYNGMPQYEMSARHKGEDVKFTLYRYQYGVNIGDDRWYISILSEASPGPEDDDYYFVEMDEEDGWEPKPNGWVCFGNGVEPAPEVHIGIDNVGAETA